MATAIGDQRRRPWEADSTLRPGIHARYFRSMGCRSAGEVGQHPCTLILDRQYD